MRVSEYKTTTNPYVYKRIHLRKHLSCDRCPPHRNENGHWTKPRKKKAFQLERRKN